VPTPATAAVGSTNPVKLAAARAVLARAFPACAVRAVAAPSGVPDQPWGDDETAAAPPSAPAPPSPPSAARRRRRR
jgi:non-canonical (house-cleaning) NTP pyrophosphatase